MKKVCLISLGCDKNRVDSEHILGLLEFDKYQIVNSVKDADIVFINTCGFIDASKKESIEVIINTLSYNKKVVVTGCLIERYENELKKELPEVDLFIPIHDYFRFNNLLKTIDPELEEKGGLNDCFRMISTGSTYAYLKIGDGCSNCCSYCAIPLIRKEYHSYSLAQIRNEALSLVGKGYEELVLLEQDTTKYGSDFPNDINLVTLLNVLLEIQELKYIRLLYLYPDEISDELIDLIAHNPRILPYFDIPIQHSENHILKAMNRRGDKQYLRTLFSKIRAKIPHAIIRTTIMVGFPGETNNDINKLLKFMNEINFDHLGAFSYSREDGTASYNYPHQVRETTKARRLDLVMKEQQKISYRQNKKHIGEIMEGIVIGQSKGQYLLRSYYNAPDDIDGKIYFESSRIHSIGDIVSVKIDEAFVYDLFGHEVE